MVTRPRYIPAATPARLLHSYIYIIYTTRRRRRRTHAHAHAHAHTHTRDICEYRRAHVMVYGRGGLPRANPENRNPSVAWPRTVICDNNDASRF